MAQSKSTASSQWNLRWIWVAIFAFSIAITANGVPTTSSFGKTDGATVFDPADVICTGETTKLCQRCAKKTKSAVVYPWCCADYEGVREWCTHYLYFGLP